jgi:hypothetical protein
MARNPGIESTTSPARLKIRLEVLTSPWQMPALSNAAKPTSMAQAISKTISGENLPWWTIHWAAVCPSTHGEAANSRPPSRPA